MPTVVVVHLEAINHCLETRAEVRAAVPEALVPEDGETLELAEAAGRRLLPARRQLVDDDDVERDDEDDQSG